MLALFVLLSSLGTYCLSLIFLNSFLFVILVNYLLSDTKVLEMRSSTLWVLLFLLHLLSRKLGCPLLLGGEDDVFNFLMRDGRLELVGVVDTALAQEVFGKGVKGGIEALSHHELVRTLNRTHQRRHSSIGSPF